MLPLFYYWETIYPMEKITFTMRGRCYIALLGKIFDHDIPPRFGVISSRDADFGVVVEVDLREGCQRVGYNARRVVTIAIDRFTIKAKRLVSFGEAFYPGLAFVEPYRDFPPISFPMGVENVFPSRLLQVRSKGRKLPQRRAAEYAKSRTMAAIAKKRTRSSLLHVNSGVWDLFDEKRLAFKARFAAKQYLWMIDLDEHRLDVSPQEEATPYEWSMWLSSVLTLPTNEKVELLLEQNTAIRLRKIISALESSKLGKKRKRGSSDPSARISKKSVKLRETEDAPQRNLSNEVLKQNTLESWPVSEVGGFTGDSIETTKKFSSCEMPRASLADATLQAVKPQ